MLILGWLFAVIFGAILGAVFRSHKSKIGGFISGLIIPFVTFFAVAKILVEKNSVNTYDLLPIILILFPLTLINIQAIYNSGVQDGSGVKTFGKTGVVMQVNKGLVYGTLIGVLASILIFTRFSF
jgi:hypothetical protein